MSDLTPHERQILRSAGWDIPDHAPEDVVNRARHLAWAKERALEYVDAGDLTNAWASLVSDLGKHSETRGHPGIELGMMLAMGGFLNTEREIREHIEGFN